MWFRQWGQRDILAIQSDNYVLLAFSLEQLVVESLLCPITQFATVIYLQTYDSMCSEDDMTESTFMSKCKAQYIERFMWIRCIVDYQYRAQNKRRQFAAIIFLFHMAEVWSSKKVHFGRNIRTINCQCTRNWSILSKINPVPEEHRRKSGAILLTKIWNGFFIFYLFSENNLVSCQGWNRSWWFSRHLVQNFDSADLPQLVWLDCQNWFSAAILVENMVADLIWCFFSQNLNKMTIALGWTSEIWTT